MQVFARRSILGGALGVAACAGRTPADRADLAVAGARLYTAPGAAPIDEATILIGDGRILDG